MWVRDEREWGSMGEADLQFKRDLRVELFLEEDSASEVKGGGMNGFEGSISPIHTNGESKT